MTARADSLTPLKLTPAQRAERVEIMARYWMLEPVEIKRRLFAIALIEAGRIGEEIRN